MYWLCVVVVWWAYLAWSQGNERREAIESVEAWHAAASDGVEGALEALGAAIETLKYV